VHCLRYKYGSAASEERDRAKEVYKGCKKRVRAGVKERKKRLEEEEGIKMTNHFQENIKLFWKEVKKSRSGPESGCMKVIKSKDGKMLTNEKEIKERWMKYFEEVFESSPSDSDSSSETCMNDDGVNGTKISMDEIQRSIKRMKNGKAVGFDNLAAEYFKGDSRIILTWLCKLFNQCLEGELHTIILGKGHIWNVGITGLLFNSFTPL